MSESVPDPPLTLDQLIAGCAAETHLRINAPINGPDCTALWAALAADADMASTALQMIEDGAPLESRDAITRWRSALLRHALGV